MRRRSSRSGRLAAFPVALMVVVATVVACSSSPAGGEPGAVVKDALAKVAAKDVEGLRPLACAGAESQVEALLGLPAGLGSMLPGSLDASSLMAAVQLDVSRVRVGDATVTGDTAEVPLTGTMGVQFDPDTVRPILRQVLGPQASDMTDAQLDAMLQTLQAFAGSIPVNQSVRLVRESGAWKICPGG